MDDQQLRSHITYLLRGGGAHIDFESAFAGLPKELRGATVSGVPHSLWQLLEHLRICQWDILEYSRDPTHVSPKFPDGLWPEEHAPRRDDDWDRSLDAFRSDHAAMIELVENPQSDLLAQLPHGKTGHTLLREALLVADHNAYHLGQVIIIRRALGAWSEETS